MHILCAIHLASAFDVGVCRWCVPDETLDPLLTFGVPLDGLHDKAVRGPPGFARERGDSRFEPRRKLHGCCVSGHGRTILHSW